MGSSKWGKGGKEREKTGPEIQMELLMTFLALSTCDLDRQVFDLLNTKSIPTYGRKQHHKQRQPNKKLH